VATDRYVTMTLDTGNCDPIVAFFFLSSNLVMGDFITTIIVISICVGFVQGNIAMRKMCVTGG